ncbi:ABC transporter ATP-binding protein [Amycolatopsis jejuensis]|uniref:ABC transporter ATP-binding protein n=1 Tax=Amycolatopsis jejuensis TaxID=330084 RepID=UPI000AB28932|nr:ABC transporter ATP-binding protein [Amycolatopsis jejuensis]
MNGAVAETRGDPRAGRGTATGIRADGAEKVFPLGRGKSVRALAPVDLDVASGEFVSLLGPSGCGKTTLLRLIAGLETPTDGTVSVGERSPAEMVRAHRVGYCFQEHALLPWASVQENIALPFRLAKRPVDPARVAELVEMIGLAGFEKARPKQLSGGMRQRVAIARALVLDPDVLLLDEPFGALDEITRRRMNLELARIWQATGVTTVLVTHSIDEAILLSDRIVVMSARPGRVHAVVPVPASRPRSAESLQEPESAQLARQLTGLLDAPGGSDEP